MIVHLRKTKHESLATIHEGWYFPSNQSYYSKNFAFCAFREEIQKLKELSDEEDERSQSLRRKREQAEKELEEAKKPKVQTEEQTEGGDKMNNSGWDDDEDTFNDLDVPGMESPRKWVLVAMVIKLVAKESEINVERSCGGLYDSCYGD